MSVVSMWLSRQGRFDEFPYMWGVHSAVVFFLESLPTVDFPESVTKGPPQSDPCPLLSDVGFPQSYRAVAAFSSQHPLSLFWRGLPNR